MGKRHYFMCLPGNFAKFSNILCILVNIQQTLWNNRLFHCIYLKMLNYAATYLKFSIMDSEIKYLPWILNNNFYWQTISVFTFSCAKLARDRSNKGYLCFFYWQNIILQNKHMVIDISILLMKHKDIRIS